MAPAALGPFLLLSGAWQVSPPVSRDHSSIHLPSCSGAHTQGSCQLLEVPTCLTALHAASSASCLPPHPAAVGVLLILHPAPGMSLLWEPFLTRVHADEIPVCSRVALAVTSSLASGLIAAFGFLAEGRNVFGPHLLPWWLLGFFKIFISDHVSLGEASL